MKRFALLMACVLSLSLGLSADAAQRQVLKETESVKVASMSMETEEIALKFPQLVALVKDKHEAKMNKVIKEKVDEMLAPSRGAIRQSKTKLAMDYKVTYNAKHILSLTLTLTGYGEDARQAIGEMQGLTFDTKEGDLLDPRGLVRHKDLGLTKEMFSKENVNERLLAAASSGKVNLLADFKGVGMDVDNYYLSEEGKVMAIYQPYQVAPFKEGVIVIALN